MNLADTPTWQYAAFALLALVVLANYVWEERAKRRAATVPAPAPVEDPQGDDPAVSCSVDECPRPATKERAGWPLCVEDYAARVTAREATRAR
jgi:hypothetical protein